MKLLNRSIQSYLFYAIGILLISIPLFYFVIQAIIARDVDKSLKAQRTEVIARLDRMTDRDPFALLDLYGPDVILNRINIYKSYDSLYTVSKRNPLSPEPISYRILESNVLIRGIPYKIMVQNSLVNSEDLIQSIVLIISLLLVVIIGGLLLINRIISGKIWRPFYQTLTYLRHFRVDSKQPVGLPNTSIDEFADLNRVVQSLTENNKKLYESQKEFTENASHEMQTPLAVMQGKLELLMQTSPLSAEQAALMGDMADASQRMYRLNKSLLLLTRIDNSQFAEREEILVADTIRRLVKQYESAMAGKEIIADLQLDDSLVLTTNKALLEILLSNLLSNAVRHNVSGGTIRVSLKDNKLMVQNSGRVTPLDSEKIFTRFHKESTDLNSIGLGLEIVRKICLINGYTIEYNFRDSLHTFTVRFA